MSGKRPVDVLTRQRFGYSVGGLSLAGTYGTRDAGIAGAIKRLAKWAKITPGGAALAYDTVLIVRAPGEEDAHVAYPRPEGLNGRGTDVWSPRECQDAVLDGTLKPMRVKPCNGNAYCPDNWEPWT